VQNKEVMLIIRLAPNVPARINVHQLKLEEDIVDIVNKRTKENKAKYSQRQAIIEQVFGTLKRGMNFDFLLLRGFKKVAGEVSIAFFSYNLKRSINILGVQNFLGYLVNPNIMKVA
jgi:hypothetical protein